MRDKEIIDTELQLKDLETVENRLGKIQKQATSGGDKSAKRAVELLLQYKAVLEQGRSARTVELEKKGPQAGCRSQPADRQARALCLQRR